MRSSEVVKIFFLPLLGFNLYSSGPVIWNNVGAIVMMLELLCKRQYYIL